MDNNRLRRQIAWEAARLIHARQESQYHQARLRAARRLGRGRVSVRELPGAREIRSCLKQLRRMTPDAAGDQMLEQRRMAAVSWMRLLAEYQPRLVDDCLTGPTRRRGIALHVFSDRPDDVARHLAFAEVAFARTSINVYSHLGIRQLVRLAIAGDVPVRITIYPIESANKQFRHRTTRKLLERAALAEIEQLVRNEYPGSLGDDGNGAAHRAADRFEVYRKLLEPLERYRLNPQVPSEGDLLYYSLHVFELVRDEQPYDEELLLAALLHDVGRAIDPTDPITAALESLDGHVTSRTEWLILHQAQAWALDEQTLGARSRRRLASNENFGDLELLGRSKRLGRRRGADVMSLDEALDYLRELDKACEE